MVENHSHWLLISLETKTDAEMRCCIYCQSQQEDSRQQSRDLALFWMKISNKLQDWIFPHYNKSGSNIKQISAEGSLFICTHTWKRAHTHTHTHWGCHEIWMRGAKLCKLGPLSQQVDEDNWIRWVWSLRPRDQSSGTSGHSHAHTQARTHTQMRTPCRGASEAAAWLIKGAWHPYPGLTSRCRATGPGSVIQAPSEKQADLGGINTLLPLKPTTTWSVSQEDSGICVWMTTAMLQKLLVLRQHTHTHTCQVKINRLQLHVTWQIHYSVSFAS